MRKKLIIVAFAMLVPFILTSCGAPPDDADFVPRKFPGADKAKDVVEDKEQKLDLSVGKTRNIFVSYLAGEEGADTEVLLKGPLECCPLGELKLKVIVSGIGESFAYIQTPDKKRHKVLKGDILGSNKGKVISIESGKVIVSVPVYNDFGDFVSYDEFVIALPKRGSR